MGEAVVRVRALVHGRVQMVGYRAFVISHAGALGLAGTVANQPDGTVEAMLEGPKADVERMLGLLRQGPSHARVERVDVEFSAPTGKLPAMMEAT
jgi:acylphosphatase